MALCPSAMPDAHTRPRWVSLSGSDNAAADEAQDWSDLCWNVAPSRGYVPVAIFYEVRTVPNPSAGSGTGGGGGGGGGPGGGPGGKGGGKGGGRGYGSKGKKGFNKSQPAMQAKGGPHN